MCVCVCERENKNENKNETEIENKKAKRKKEKKKGGGGEERERVRGASVYESNTMWGTKISCNHDNYSSKAPSLPFLLFNRFNILYPTHIEFKVLFPREFIRPVGTDVSEGIWFEHCKTEVYSFWHCPLAFWQHA